MADENVVKPYFLRIRDWKVRNMVMMYLEAREKFMSSRRFPFRDISVSYERLREISDILFGLKEDYHLIFKRALDPEKGKYEKSHKITPDEVEAEFMNNIGLLFHKVMVTRELKYSMEHYVEDSRDFQRSKDNLQYQQEKIAELFEHGIEIIRNLLRRYKDNILMLSYLIEEPSKIRRHFGRDAFSLLHEYLDDQGLDEVCFKIGKYFLKNGWQEKASKMFKETLKHNPQHVNARRELSRVASLASI